MSYPYTVIGYIGDGSESCRGYVTDSWSADMMYGQFETYKDAVEFSRTIVEKSVNHLFSNYDIVLLHMNGNEQFWPNSRSDDQFTTDMNTAEVEIRAEKERKEQERLQQRIRDAQVTAEASRRAQYEKLKLEFGDCQ